MNFIPEDANDLNSHFMQMKNEDDTEPDLFHVYEEPYDFNQNSVLHSLYERKLSPIQNEETQINHINKLFISIKTNQKCYEQKEQNNQKKIETISESDIHEYTAPINIPDPNVKTFHVFTNPSISPSLIPLEEEYNRINFDALNYNKEKIVHLKIKSGHTHLGRKRQRKVRKYKPDDIRKKIKSRFHKTLKNIINYRLAKAGSKKLFDFLPQSFICNIAKEKNRRLLNLSYYELLKIDFSKEINIKKYIKKKVNEAKYLNNLNVLDYLDIHPEICKKSGFDVISKMKYIDILTEYFSSTEFKYSIISLKEENEDLEYIKEYLSKAKGYIEFFSR